jgi:predicted nucleotidyltransferase
MNLNLQQQYAQERSQLLRIITEALEKDERVKAAWLFGSLGCGEEDALSDIDLWVIVEDSWIGEIINRPHPQAALAAQPIFFVEAPQNAPEGGAYLMACYDAPTAPHIVDWYWQPLSNAYIPDHVRLLFDKHGLEHKTQAIVFPDRPSPKELLDAPGHLMRYFWMMLMITAKYAGRMPWDEEMELFSFVIKPLAQVQFFLNPTGPSQDIELPQRTPQEKVKTLYLLADRMSALMVDLSQRGMETPDAIVPGAYRYLRMIEQGIATSQS